ncbi:hypothetical protein WT97_20955 [Burkholderia sp. MSMB1459WGS]|uniref:helix-turn-helix transcriptional regulator n=1 Tax=Burkholderia sp. MSMB1459WGS TaxID=1637970 RepID=UPI00075F8C01|nr:helix-turn-helix domain-containing protein [Burkholderia sp. MSMB1459WGS]KWO40479.1 hypothetical protein WT97_20955 [Burkholderia sp. MSMB1459WGS]
MTLSDDLLDLLADRIASRITARLRERQSTHQPGRTAPGVPAVPELRADRLYRVRDAAYRLGVSRATVYNMARAGRLELVKIGARASGVTGRSLIALIGS